MSFLSVSFALTLIPQAGYNLLNRNTSAVFDDPQRTVLNTYKGGEFLYPT